MPFASVSAPLAEPYTLALEKLTPEEEALKFAHVATPSTALPEMYTASVSFGPAVSIDDGVQLRDGEINVAPAGQAEHAVAELPANAYEFAGQAAHDAEDPEPKTKYPAPVHPHERLAPLPVHEKSVEALQVPAPVAEIEPVGHGLQLAAEFPAKE